MEIECPDCEARYDVADAIVPPGRSVRCVRCGTTWVPRPGPERGPVGAGAWGSGGMGDAGEANAELAGASTDRHGRERLPDATPLPVRPPSLFRSPPTSLPLAAAWLGSVALLLLACWSLVHFRRAIAADWPPSARLYASLGLGLGR